MRLHVGAARGALSKKCWVSWFNLCGNSSPAFHTVQVEYLVTWKFYFWILNHRGVRENSPAEKYKLLCNVCSPQTGLPGPYFIFILVNFCNTPTQTQILAFLGPSAIVSLSTALKYMPTLPFGQNPICSFYADIKIPLLYLFLRKIDNTDNKNWYAVKFLPQNTF